MGIKACSILLPPQQAKMPHCPLMMLGMDKEEILTMRKLQLCYHSKIKNACMDNVWIIDSLSSVWSSRSLIRKDGNNFLFFKCSGVLHFFFSAEETFINLERLHRGGISLYGILIHLIYILRVSWLEAECEVVEPPSPFLLRPWSPITNSL